MRLAEEQPGSLGHNGNMIKTTFVRSTLVMQQACEKTEEGTVAERKGRAELLSSRGHEFDDARGVGTAGTGVAVRARRAWQVATQSIGIAGWALRRERHKQMLRDFMSWSPKGGAHGASAFGQCNERRRERESGELARGPRAFAGRFATHQVGVRLTGL